MAQKLFNIRASLMISSYGNSYSRAFKIRTTSSDIAPALDANLMGKQDILRAAI